jgi:hypothetical protein
VAPIVRASAQCQIGRAVPVDAADRTIAFPIKARSGERFFEDAEGNPFFVHVTLHGRLSRSCREKP